LEALHYTVAALQQVTQQTIENCFRKAGYVQGQSSGDSDVVLTNDDDFRPDWEKFSGMKKIYSRTACLWTVTWQPVV
jgi:hypothetical protein